MIDWWDVIVNGLWIAGLAIFLASVSYLSAAKHYTKGGADEPGKRKWLWSGEIWPAVGLALFCLGLGLASDQTWKQVVWLALFVLSLAQPFIARRFESSKKGNPKSSK